jgi:hypothetical protein
VKVFAGVPSPGEKQAPSWATPWLVSRRRPDGLEGCACKPLIGFPREGLPYLVSTVGASRPATPSGSNGHSTARAVAKLRRRTGAGSQTT